MKDKEQTVRTYSPMVYRLAFSLLKNREDAEDIHQEVFCKYLKTAIRFDSEEHAKAWFIRVTVNCCKNYWKSAWNRKRVDVEQDAENTSARGTSNINAFGTILQAEPDERSEKVIETVKTLPQKYRVVIHLFYYEELSVEEISRCLSQKPATVRTHLTRARAILREKLKEEI